MTASKSDGALTFLGVIALVIGGFAAFGGLAALAILGAGDAYFSALSSISTGGVGHEASAQMYTELAAIQKKWSVWTGAIGLFNLPIGGALVYGGFQILRKKTGVMELLTLAFAAAFILELVAIYPNVSLQMETVEATQHFTEAFSKDLAGRGPQGDTVAKLTTSITQGSQAAGVIMGFLMIAVKLGCIVWALVFIRKRRGAPDPAPG